MLLPLALVLLGCDPAEEPVEPDSGAPVLEDGGSRCGNGLCERSLGESSGWCEDCRVAVDATLGPGYCGDQVCNNGETMISCYRDCRPRPINGFQPWLPPGPQPDPGP